MTPGGHLSLPFTRMLRWSSGVEPLATGCQCRGRLNAGNQSVPVTCELAKVALDLDAMPELVRLTEESAKAN